MRSPREPTPLIVSFSGIDGAGKSTQIQSLESWLTAAGCKVTVLRMWDDLVPLRALREFASRNAFRGDQGIGSPEHPLERRDKNVQSGIINFFRCCLYFVDAVTLRFRVRSLEKTCQKDVVIFDRYIYDELANLPLKNSKAKRFAELLARLAPAPHVAYVIDADPESTRKRKPEYPLEFLQVNREAFLTLAELIRNLIVVQNDCLEDASVQVRNALLARIALYSPAFTSAGDAPLSEKVLSRRADGAT